MLGPVVHSGPKMEPNNGSKMGALSKVSIAMCLRWHVQGKRSKVSRVWHVQGKRSKVSN